MSGLFSTLYADTGRACIAPEKLMRAQLLQLFHSIRRERMLMEQLHYNLLFRWFVGITIDERSRLQALPQRQHRCPAELPGPCAHGARAGHAISLRTRAWIETHFGWLKAAAGMRQGKQRGIAKVQVLFQLAMAASNLVRLPKLIARRGRLMAGPRPGRCARKPENRACSELEMRSRNV